MLLEELLDINVTLWEHLRNLQTYKIIHIVKIGNGALTALTKYLYFRHLIVNAQFSTVRHTV